MNLLKHLGTQLHPRYWLVHLGIGLLWLLAWLPHGLQLKLGTLLGRLLHTLARERRRITRINIGLCYPDLDASGQAGLVRAAFESYGMTILETGTTWLRGIDHLKDRFEVTGLEHVRAAQAAGHGVLIIGAHFSTIDICGALLAQHLDMDVIYRPSRNPVFDRLIRKGRGRYFRHVISKEDTRSIIRSLREGRVIWYAADQNYARRHSVFAPFFGIQAATIRGTSRLVSMTGAVAVFGSQFRLDGGRRYYVNLSPVLEDFPSTSEVEDAARVNRMIETALADHPEQYLWLHRRFKTRPEGEPAIY